MNPTQLEQQDQSWAEELGVQHICCTLKADRLMPVLGLAPGSLTKDGWSPISLVLHSTHSCHTTSRPGMHHALLHPVSTRECKLMHECVLFVAEDLAQGVKADESAIWCIMPTQAAWHTGHVLIRRVRLWVPVCLTAQVWHANKDWAMCVCACVCVCVCAHQDMHLLSDQECWSAFANM